MPKGPIPENYLDILQSTALGHLATVDETGRPQVNPVWFIWDGEHLLIGVLDKTKKLENVRRDPHVAVSIGDQTNQARYVEIRGEVISVEVYYDLAFVNQLSQKYTGHDYTYGVAGDARFKFTIRVDSWTGQG